MIKVTLADQANAIAIDNTSRKLGIIFKQVRHKRSLSQNSLSEAANINNSYYCCVERGTVNVTMKKFFSICGGLGIPPVEVMRRLASFQEDTEEYKD